MGVSNTSVNRVVTIRAKPEPLTIDTPTTAVIVVDMQNDFCTKGGMFDRAGIDISGTPFSGSDSELLQKRFPA